MTKDALQTEFWEKEKIYNNLMPADVLHSIAELELLCKTIRQNIAEKQYVDTRHIDFVTLTLRIHQAQIQKGDNMQLTTLRSSIEVVKHQAAHFGFHHLGYSDEEIQMASGPVPWLGIQRSAVKGIIQEFSMGALSLQGLSPMAIPAEYMAAVIVSVVHPTNWMLACRWVERTEPAQTMGQSGETIIHEPVTARALIRAHAPTRRRRSNGCEITIHETNCPHLHKRGDCKCEVKPFAARKKRGTKIHFQGGYRV